MSIRKEIKVTRKGLDVVLDVTYGTELLPIEFKVVDYQIPEGATAVAYSEGTDGIKKLLCDIEDNTIIFTPITGFFVVGKNDLQLRVVHNNKSLFSFKCKVNCHGSYADSDAEEVGRNSSLVEQVLTEQAVLKARFEEVLKLPEDGTDVEKAVNDIKVGANGKVYSSPGEAVRQQVSQLSEQIDAKVKPSDILSKSDNLYNYRNELVNKWVTPSGNISDTPGGCVAIVPVEENQIISLAIVGKTGSNYASTVIGALCFRQGETKLSYEDMLSLYVGEVTIEDTLTGYIVFKTPENCDNIIFSTALSYDNEWKNIYINYGNKIGGDGTIFGINGKGYLPQGLEDIICDNYEHIPIPYFADGFLNYYTNVMETTYKHKVLDVICGDVYKIEGYSFQAIRPVVFTDGINVIDYFPKESSPTQTFVSLKVEVPPKAKKMYINLVWNGGSDRQYYASVYKKIGSTLKHHDEKKLSIIGDSLSEPFSGVPTVWHQLLSAHDNFAVANMARSGHGYKRADNGLYAFHTQAQFVDVDTEVCLIFGSFNDMTHYSVLGDINDTDTSTICGCVNTTLDTLFSKNLGMKVGVILPTPWKSTYPTQTEGEDYVGKVKSICQKRGIPCLDLFHESGLRPLDTVFVTEYYNEEAGVHPNSKGHKEYIYPHVREFVKSII